MALKKIRIYFPATNITVAISVAESHNLIKREKNRWLSCKQHLRKSKHDFRKMQRAAFYAKKYHLAPWRVLGIDKCGGLRPPQQSTRHSKTTEKTKPKARRRGAVPAEPLRRRLPLFRRARLSILWFSFSALCLLKAVALAALQAFSIPPHCLFGWLRIA